MSFTFNIGGFGGYQTGGYEPAWARPTPPQPPPPTEIRFEHDGEQHRLLVADDVLQNLLRLSAQYEQQQRQRRPPPAPSVPLTVRDAVQQIRILSQTSDDIPLKTAIRRAKRIHHPDTGGTANGFRMVTDAERTLIRAGVL